MKLTIPNVKVFSIANSAKTFFARKAAEIEIIRLIFVKNIIDAMIKKAIHTVMANAQKANKNVVGVYGDYVKIYKRYFGKKYEVINPDVVPKEFLNITYSVKSDAVDDYYSRYGKLPDGIAERIRERKTVINEGEIIRKIKDGTIDINSLILNKVFSKEFAKMSDEIFALIGSDDEEGYQ